MKMTDEGMALIRQFEGFRGTAYCCPSGLWTIGYGHTSGAGLPAVIEGMTMSEVDAEKVLATDVEVFAAGVRQALKRGLPDAQFSALVSFAYNVGIGGFRSSSVLKAVNAGDFDAVPRRLQLWVKGGGRVLPGLVRRRAAEAELFISDAGSASSADAGVPEAAEGKSAGRSTTVVSALVAALAALLSGGVGAASGSGTVLLLFAAVGIAAAAWIIRERLLKAKEEGI